MEVIRPGDHVFVKIYENPQLLPDKQQEQFDEQVDFWARVLPDCTLHFLRSRSEDFGVQAIYRPSARQGSV